MIESVRTKSVVGKSALDRLKKFTIYLSRRVHLIQLVHPLGVSQPPCSSLSFPFLSTTAKAKDDSYACVNYHGKDSYNDGEASTTVTADWRTTSYTGSNKSG